MSPDYSEYSQKELREALTSIDKGSYPENYEKLVLELSKRDLHSGSNEPLPAMESLSQRNNIPCSFKRIFAVIALGVLGSIPVVALAEPSEPSKDELVWSVLIVLMAGLPLLHSFLCSWTLSKHGIVTRQEDNFSFTLMQLFYSYVCSLVILLAIVRWP